MQQVNPPELPVLQRSLHFTWNPFVVIKDDLLGFMDFNAQLLGEIAWDDITLYNDKRAAVSSPKNHKWGYLDETGQICIEPQYKEFGFFNYGYAKVTHDNGREIVIGHNGEILVAPKYKKIIHYKDRLYIVCNDNNEWGMISTEKKLVVPFATVAQSDEEQIAHEVIMRYVKQLKDIVEEKNKMALSEYVKLFEPFTAESDIKRAGLWDSYVKVKLIPEQYLSVVTDPSEGRIGWYYPASASVFNLDEECPVIFDKKDGETLTLGISWKDIELRIES